VGWKSKAGDLAATQARYVGTSLIHHQFIKSPRSSKIQLQTARFRLYQNIGCTKTKFSNE
jgi:hypothetical protein